MPAIASVQPIHTLTDPPLSPASRLLQEIRNVRAFRGGTITATAMRGGLPADLALQLSALSFFDAFTHSAHVHRPPVGAGLLAIASVQPIHTLTDPPLSPASRLLQGIVFIQHICISLVGASLLAMASFQAINASTDPPPSPASRLLQGARLLLIFTTHQAER